MLTTLVILAFVALAQSHDISVGSNNGRKIFDEVRHASPTIWRQTENLTINTTDAEVISRVAITDLRPDKDGDAKILEGGEGHKNVTIELKSPTVLRGYDFQVQVYAVQDDNQDQVQQGRKQRNPEEFTKIPSDAPTAIFDDENEEPTTDKNGSNDTQLYKHDGNTHVDDDDDTTDRSTTAIPETKGVSDQTRNARDVTTEATESSSHQATPKDTKDQSKYSTVLPNHDNIFVNHPGVDFSNYTSDEIFPKNNISGAQDEQRPVRDITTDEKTQSPTVTEQQSKADGTKTPSTTSTETSVTQDPKLQDTKINAPFPEVRQQYPVPYPIVHTVTETKKSQNKRESEQNTKTQEKDDVKIIPSHFPNFDEQTEKDGVKITPSFGDQKTTSGPKPVISIQ